LANIGVDGQARAKGKIDVGSERHFCDSTAHATPLLMMAPHDEHRGSRSKESLGEPGGSLGSRRAD
jgi:hypothetical protein